MKEEVFNRPNEVEFGILLVGDRRTHSSIESLALLQHPVMMTGGNSGIKNGGMLVRKFERSPKKYQDPDVMNLFSNKGYQF